MIAEHERRYGLALLDLLREASQASSDATERIPGLPIAERLALAHATAAYLEALDRAREVTR